MQPNHLSFLSVFILTLTLLSCSSQTKSLSIYEQEKVMMGTVMKIKAVAKGDAEAKTEEAFGAAFREISALESELSEWQPGSPVSEVNRNAGTERVAVPEAVVTVTQKALDIAEVTEGAFDVTFKPIGRLWNVKERTSPPPPDSIRAALKQVDYKQIELDTLKNTLFLKREGMEIGFGGIAKGYAALHAGRILEEYGIGNYIINAGGDLYVKGSKGERRWTSGIKNPDKQEGKPLLAFSILKSCGIATSGNYENFFIHEGIRYHHIIDLSTGYPSRGMKSTTVFSEDPAIADAYATAFFILGYEKSLQIVQNDPSLAFILIDEKGTIYKSPNIGEFIQELQ